MQDFEDEDNLEDVPESQLAVEIQKSTLDHLLLVLHDALLQTQAERWTAEGVANLEHDDTYELARWFLRGQDVGRKPIFQGMCTYCAAWLHGDQNQHSALSNKTTGPPVNRDGQKRCTPAGEPDTHSQPPCILRYSPSFFAEEAPELFAHDASTNRLMLKPDFDSCGAEVERHPPWIRPPHSGCKLSLTRLCCRISEQRCSYPNKSLSPMIALQIHIRLC